MRVPRLELAGASDQCWLIVPLVGFHVYGKDSAHHSEPDLQCPDLALLVRVSVVQRLQLSLRVLVAAFKRRGQVLERQKQLA